jgi:predicted enzyme related to lactoylglutathione lyase
MGFGGETIDLHYRPTNDWIPGKIRSSSEILKRTFYKKPPTLVHAMKIKYASVFVADQGKALKFYTDTLGFVKKADVRAGNYRWLTVVAPDDQNGTELLLEPNDNPAARAYQEALFAQGISATMFLVDDVQKEYEKLIKLGVKFTMEPTKLPVGSIIAVLDDTCGNLVQITQLQPRTGKAG